jgi:hypothetical protein
MNKSVYEDMQESEIEVSEYLRNLNIKWQYEQPVYVLDDKDRPRVWTPDFYLPQLGIYLEVCGTDKFHYEYREIIYKKNHIPVIFIHRYKHKKEWQKYLKKRIEEIHQQRWEIIKKIK